MIFINLEKAYDRVPRRVMWCVKRRKKIPLKYIKVIKDKYDRAVISVVTSRGIASELPITITPPIYDGLSFL